jgi:hypothetical protein
MIHHQNLEFPTLNKTMYMSLNSNNDTNTSLCMYIEAHHSSHRDKCNTNQSKQITY